MHFVGLFFSSLLKMHGPKNKIQIFCRRNIWAHIYKIYCKNSPIIFAMPVRPFILEQLDKV